MGLVGSVFHENGIAHSTFNIVLERVQKNIEVEHHFIEETVTSNILQLE